jgi:hypothetical protein
MNDIDRNFSYMLSAGLVTLATGIAYVGKCIHDLVDILNPNRYVVHVETASSTNGTICYQDDDGDEVTSKYCPRKK